MVRAGRAKPRIPDSVGQPKAPALGSVAALGYAAGPGESFDEFSAAGERSRGGPGGESRDGSAAGGGPFLAQPAAGGQRFRHAPAAAGGNVSGPRGHRPERTATARASAATASRARTGIETPAWGRSRRSRCTTAI